MPKTHTETDILILGVGIGGYEAYRTLAKQLKKIGSNRRITLVDQNNYFTFTPLLHEVSTGGVLPHHTSFAIREVIAGTPHNSLSARVTGIDPAQKKVSTSAGTLTYNTIIVALGSVSNLYNTPGADEHTYCVRTLAEALDLQHTVMKQLEEKKRTSLDITIIGGGYTGVEIAAEFAHLATHELRTLYPHITTTVHLAHADDILVPHLPSRASSAIKEQLIKLGTTLHLGERVVQVSPKEVLLASGASIPTDVAIWVTGFTTIAPQLFSEEYIERDRVPVTTHLHLKNHPDTYVIGDIALIRDPDNNDIIYPQLGEAAHHEGIYAAKHIIATMLGKDHKHFHFRSKGTLMPVGPWFGIGVFGPIIIKGKFAWWLRRTVYILFMPGIIRKLRIIADWTWVSKSVRHFIYLKK